MRCFPAHVTVNRSRRQRLQSLQKNPKSQRREKTEKRAKSVRNPSRLSDSHTSRLATHDLWLALIQLDILRCFYNTCKINVASVRILKRFSISPLLKNTSQQFTQMASRFLESHTFSEAREDTHHAKKGTSSQILVFFSHRLV